MAKGNGGTMWLKRSFNFVDKDPEIDVFRTLYQKQRIKEDDLAALAGCSTSTVKNMFGGKTKRPQHVTYTKLAHAMGHEYALTLNLAPNYETEIPIAKEQRKQYRAYLAKKRAKQTRGKKS